jgi:prepilin-type N-terminal cleavage/methylation domain-containing protein
MSEKKKGFTLVEVIVVMLVATLVFAMVGGAMVFITTTSGELLHQSEEIELAKNVEKYLREKQFSISGGNVEPKIELKDGTDDLFDGDEMIFADTRLVFFGMYQEENFIKCKMEFESGRHFDFIVETIQ